MSILLHFRKTSVFFLSRLTADVLLALNMRLVEGRLWMSVLFQVRHPGHMDTTEVLRGFLTTAAHLTYKAQAIIISAFFFPPWSYSPTAVTSKPIFVFLLGTACFYRKSPQTKRWLPHEVIAMRNLVNFYRLVLSIEQMHPEQTKQTCWLTNSKKCKSCPRAWVEKMVRISREETEQFSPRV